MSNQTTQLSPPTSNPLGSRLDSLDFLMKLLERKQNLQRLEMERGSDVSLSGEMKRHQSLMPVEMALKEAQIKGSLLDRVASLENRLFQLCLEMESSNASRTSSSVVSTQTVLGDNSSSSHLSKGESSLSSSYPTFNSNFGINRRISQVHFTTSTAHEIQEENTVHKQQQKLEHPSDPPKKQTKKKNGANKDGKSSKSFKKKSPPSWPHFKLLGCS
ncbi:hypothetical protein UlMin_001130 [Ulmus minor]